MPNLTAALGGISWMLVPTFEVDDRGPLRLGSERRHVLIEANGVSRGAA
jgi:hypothetical protein